MAKFKISYYAQSHSMLYLRDILPLENGLFQCLVFSDVVRMNLQDMFEFEAMRIVESNDRTRKEFYFEGGEENYVIAMSVSVAEVRDFPIVPKVEIVGPSLKIEPPSWIPSKF